MDESVRRRILARLRPLYLVAFFNGLVFWYTVDKLLATRVGVSTAQIGVIMAIMAVVTVVAEVPSGIWADRWSRKGVLLISLVSLAAATFCGLIATNVWHYLMLSICWGIYAAMYSGTYEAIVYDVLIEEQGHGRGYEELFGRVGQYESIGLVIGSFLGGVFASTLNIRLPFALTLVSLLIAIAMAVRFTEPKVHKTHEVVNMLSHVRATFRAVVASRALIQYLIISILLGVTLRIFWEYLQYWYIQLGLPLVLFGFANGAVLFMMWLRGWAAARTKTQRHLLLVIALAGMFVSALALTVRNAYVAAVTLVVVMFCGLLAELVLSGLRQDLLPSRLRAGAGSVFGSGINLAFVPASIAFGALAMDGKVTTAVWLPLVLILGAGVMAVSAMRSAHRTVE